MNSSFSLRGSSDCKCVWKKHVTARGAANRNAPVYVFSHPGAHHHITQAGSLMVGFYFYLLPIIWWSCISAMKGKLWYGTRRLFELLKPCMGLMVVEKHARLIWVRKRGDACRDLMEKWIYLTWWDVSLNPVALVKDYAERNIARNAWMFLHQWTSSIERIYALFSENPL